MILSEPLFGNNIHRIPVAVNYFRKSQRFARKRLKCSEAHFRHPNFHQNLLSKAGSNFDNFHGEQMSSHEVL
ncbi:hypothetical protein Y032_0014g2215 [Ancylostoma ceylanicum]|uniref:Uncharacterized protein n=1 Tax=Ancylostoma ceylanicum TaxID=53326 RepID=A0A016V904_9BILA|nr:hypothetical protein Y032_0014g2215 [Ancylostoma ceylanicum]